MVRDARHGETVCSDCGLVVAEGEIDRGPEWRGFDHGERERKSRVGAPITDRLHDKGLSTAIDWQDKDAYGNRLSARKRQRMSRLRTWNKRFRTHDAGQRNLRQALGEIDRMASALGVPETTCETASVTYRRALEAGLLPGRSIEAIATAALYTATKAAGAPRTIDEVAAVSRIDRTEFTRAYRYVVRELGLEIVPAGSAQHLPRYVSELDLYPSESNGISFCTGNFIAMGADLSEAIHHFGDNIHYVHFRDVEGDAEDVTEVWHDAGPTDMLAAMRAFHEIGFDGPMRPDHVPTMQSETNERPGYEMKGRILAVGYMRGLIEAVTDE